MTPRTLLLVGLALPVAAPALAENAAEVARAEGSTSDGGLLDGMDLRLTLSSFLYRETGTSAPALVDQGAELQNASPVRRTFGELRLELTAEPLELDARVRQTGAQRFQSGASGAGEYELRTLAYRLGSARTQLTVGRQLIDAAGATKIDGMALRHALTERVSITAFAGAFPALGSRSLDTDYVTVRKPDGTQSARLIPLTGGVALARSSTDLHGDLGLAAVYVAQETGGAPASERSRVFATSSGYWRPGERVDVYQLTQLEAVGSEVALTNGSLGVDVHPLPALRVSANVHHVSTLLFQLATRDQLADPDPSAMGFVQNRLLTRISQDAARAGVSLALARQRFELSFSGGVRRRPAVEVELADGTGSLRFPETRSADATASLLDRRSVAGLRLALSATATLPVGDAVGNRARGTAVRLAASRTFAKEQGLVEVDVLGERLRDGQSEAACMSSLDPLVCYGQSSTTAAALGVLASWRASREWLLVADAHAGYHDVESTDVTSSIDWPRVFSIATFLRLQWRYR